MEQKESCYINKRRTNVVKGYLMITLLLDEGMLKLFTKDFFIFIYPKNRLLVYALTTQNSKVMLTSLILLSTRGDKMKI